MKYRADIDGLRAVAVLPVLFFHSGLRVFSGGYVGVDVFFVISGYLITKILADEIANHRFSILNFYERRIRRIFPCLIAVIAVSNVAAAFFLVPGDFRDFAKSDVATILFSSNILFFMQSGYFTDQSALRPLLHTWSLAVEEQFYIVFPILLWLVHRYTRDRLFLILIPIALGSFAINVWDVTKAPSFTFFMAPTRIWELFAGALLALGAVPLISNRLAREALVLLGIGLIAWAVFAYGPDTIFPGVNALLPVLGAALLIQFGEQTIVGRMLSLPPVVFVGLISYSLYLWHWPIIVFSEYYLIEKLQGWGTIAAIVSSLAIATLSWRYVERPFRIRGLFSKGEMFAGAAAAMTAMIVVGIAGSLSAGWPSRFPAEVTRLDGYSHSFSERSHLCHRDEDNVIPLEKSCAYGAPTAAEYALWGDSHASSLANELGEIAAKHNKSVIQISYSACPPALGLTVRMRPNCRDHNDHVVQFLAKNNGITTVFLVSRYEGYSELAGFSDGIRKSVDSLLRAGKRVILVYPVPIASVSIPRTLARYAAVGEDPNKFSIDERGYLARNAYAFRLLDSFADKNVVRIFPHERLCHDDICTVIIDGKSLYIDHQHLSIEGARFLRPLLEKAFQ